MLLHGYGSKKESFYYQINFLSQFFKVTAADFPCFGASEPADGAWSVGDYARWLKKFISRAGLEKPRSPRFMRKVRAYRRIKKLFPKFAEKHFGSEEYKKLSPLMRESYKKIVNEDLRADAAKILNPALLIYGKDDKVTPPYEEGEIFNSLIKNSRLEIIEGDHFCFCRNPELFNHKVLNFLN